MEIRSVKNEDWGKYKGRRVQVLQGPMYDGQITEKIGELVEEKPYILNIRLSNGVVHAFYKDQCSLVIDREEP